MSAMMIRMGLCPVAVSVALLACTPNEPQLYVEPDAAPSASARSASAPSSAPAPASASASASAAPSASPAGSAQAAASAKSEQPYSGPTATLRGVVRIKGDDPPSSNLRFPVGKCGEAAATYGKLFRVGLDHALADVLVGVTNYKGFVPAKSDTVKVTLHGCALNRRTVAAAFGQKIDVYNLDKIESYMPYLDGAPSKAVMVAVPGGPAVSLNVVQPGHYLIRDQLPKPFLTADVFVLAYSTHDVTGLDGKYEIKGIPVGKVRAGAHLPSINKTSEKEIELKEGDNTLDFTLEFDAKKDTPPPKKPEPEPAKQ